MKHSKRQDQDIYILELKHKLAQIEKEINITKSSLNYDNKENEIMKSQLEEKNTDFLNMTQSKKVILENTTKSSYSMVSNEDFERVKSDLSKLKSKMD